MKALILAAGRPTLVRPLPCELPKPMIPVLGKPVMAYLIEHLAKYGVRDIMVNVSYMHEKIEEYFGQGLQFGVTIGYSFEGYSNDMGEEVPQPLGSAGGMKKIQQFGGFFDETTIVVCGDALTDLDLTSALSEHKRKGALATVIIKEVPWRKVPNYGVVVIDDDDRVVSFQEKPRREIARSNFASTGIYIIEPEVLNLIPADTVFDIGSELFPLLVERGLPFFAQKGVCNWVDIGSVTDYWSALQRVMLGEVAHLEVSGEQIETGLWIGLNTCIDWEDTIIEGPVYIGSGSRIEAGCHIVGPTWIGHGSHIYAGAKVIRSVLFEYTRISPDACIEERIVFKEYSVDLAGGMAHGSESRRSVWGTAHDRRNRRRSGLLRTRSAAS